MELSDTLSDSSCFYDYAKASKCSNGEFLKRKLIQTYLKHCMVCEKSYTCRIRNQVEPPLPTIVIKLLFRECVPMEQFYPERIVRYNLAWCYL